VAEIEKPLHPKIYAFSHLHLIEVKVKIQLFPCLTVHHTVKACGGLAAHIFKPLNGELNPICRLMALLAHHIFHISRIRVKLIT